MAIVSGTVRLDHWRHRISYPLSLGLHPALRQSLAMQIHGMWIETSKNDNERDCVARDADKSSTEDGARTFTAFPAGKYDGQRREQGSIQCDAGKFTPVQVLLFGRGYIFKMLCLPYVFGNVLGDRRNVTRTRTRMVRGTTKARVVEYWQ